MSRLRYAVPMALCRYLLARNGAVKAWQALRHAPKLAWTRAISAGYIRTLQGDATGRMWYCITVDGARVLRERDTLNDNKGENAQ